jgi:hypothetical protein
MPVCSEKTPELRPEGSGMVACHLFT